MIPVTLSVAWLLLPDQMVWVFQNLLLSWDFHKQQSLGFRQNGVKNKKKKKESQFFSQKCIDDRGQRRTTRLDQADMKASVPQITTAYIWGEKKKHSNNETDGLH